MTWVQLGLAAVIGLPVAVIVAMIFWPSAYDDPPPAADPEPTKPLPRESSPILSPYKRPRNRVDSDGRSRTV